MTIEEIFKKLNMIAESMGYKVYAVGGFVRDRILSIPSDDIDIVVLGDSLKFTKEVQKHMKTSNVAYFKTFMTSKLDINAFKFEFVSARSESYDRNSRKPVVQKATLNDDLSRRDFTINAIAMNLGKDFGTYIDPFLGQIDIKNKCIRTPIDAQITFSDDPLRIIRAIRFSSRFSFKLDTTVLNAIQTHLYRLEIVSNERILIELEKIITHQSFPDGIIQLIETGLFSSIFKISDPIILNKITNFYKKVSSLNGWCFEDHIAYFYQEANFKSDKVNTLLKKMKYSNNQINQILKRLNNYCYYIDMSKNSNIIFKNIYIYRLGYDYETFLKFYNVINNLDQNSFTDDLNKINEQFGFSNFKLDIDGNTVMDLTHLKGKDIGDLITKMTMEVLNLRLMNTNKSLKKYIKNQFT